MDLSRGVDGGEGMVYGGTTYGGGRVGAAVDWGAVTVSDQHPTAILAVPFRKQYARHCAPLLRLVKAAYIQGRNVAAAAWRLR